MYLTPLAGMLYAHYEGSGASKRAAVLAPLVYHVASVFGIIYVFPDGLNPIIAPLELAAGTHVFYAIVLLV
jgi:hypothetical protein